MSGLLNQPATLPETPWSLIARKFPTQTEVARAAHVSMRTVSRWTSAKSCPGDRKITRIADALETTPGVCVDAFHRQRALNATRNFRLHSKLGGKK